MCTMTQYCFGSISVSMPIFIYLLSIHHLFLNYVCVISELVSYIIAKILKPSIYTFYPTYISPRIFQENCIMWHSILSETPKPSLPSWSIYWAEKSNVTTELYQVHPPECPGKRAMSKDWFPLFLPPCGGREKSTEVERKDTQFHLRHMSEWYVISFFWLTYHPYCDILKVHPRCGKWRYFILPYSWGAEGGWAMFATFWRLLMLSVFSRLLMRARERDYFRDCCSQWPI